MLTQRQHQADRSLAAEGRSAATGCRSQQAAAAAWAWFEHGGSTCITPSKAEGLMAAKRNSNCNFARPSRFKKELLSSTAMPQHSDARSDEYARRRHSFHDDDLAKRTSYTWRFSNSFRDQGKNEDEEGRCQIDHDKASSLLLDKFEVDAVCRQLNDQLQGYEAQKAHHNHLQPHIKTRRYSESSDAHQLQFTGTEHVHQYSNDVVHRLLRLRIKSSTSSRPTSATAPAFCSSIATANSIVDHRHRHPPASPKQFAKAVPLIYQTSKPQETLHDRRDRQISGRVSNHSRKLTRTQLLETAERSGAAGHHGRGEFASRNRKSHDPKMRGRSDLDQLSGAGAAPRRLHHSDLLYSKVLQPLMSRLPHMSALLGYNMHEAPSTDDRVAFTNGHRQFHKHRHIHHHHHHYHHLQHIHQGAASHEDAVVLLDNVITKNHRVDGLKPPKLYSLHKEELKIPPGGPPHHDYIAAENPPSLHQLGAQAQRMWAAANH